MRRPLPLARLALLASTLLASTAMAHPGVFHTADPSVAAQAGFLHPLTGLDHFLVMVAVGLWAVRLGGRALWLIPLSFVLPMVAGALIGIGNSPAAAAEHGITASLLLLGAALGLAWRPSLPLAVAVVAASGFSHGYAHGSEMPVGSLPLFFLAGMFLATAILHLGGVAGGRFLASRRLDVAFRVAGAALVVAAVVLVLIPG